MSTPTNVAKVKPYNTAAFLALQKLDEKIDADIRRRKALYERILQRESVDSTEVTLLRGARLVAANECNRSVRFDKDLNNFDRAVYAYTTLRRKEWRRPSRKGRRETYAGFFIDINHLRARLAHERFKRSVDGQPSEAYVYKSFNRLERLGYLKRGRESGVGRKHRGRVLYWLPRLTAEEEKQFEELSGQFKD